MLTPTQMIPFLSHQDPHVRRLAFDSLEGAHDLGPVTAEDIWNSIDKSGTGEYYEVYRLLDSMPQTELSLQRTLAAIDKEPEKHARQYLEDVVCGLKSGLLMRYVDRIEQSHALSPETRQHIRQRIELASVPSQELWEQLIEFGLTISRERKAWSEIDARIPQRLIDALSHSPEAAGWAISLLNDKSIDDWREVLAVDVLGALRFRRAEELLFTKFDRPEDDGDSVVESSVNALVRIASPHVVEEAQRRFPRWNWGTKVTAASLFNRIKLPQAEAAGFALLQSEGSIEVNTFLALAMCKLPTTHGPAVDRLVEIVTTDDYDSSIADLDQDVGALCTMLNRPKPSGKKPSRSPADLFRGPRPDPGEFIGRAPTAATTSMPVSFEQSPAPSTSIAPLRRKGIKVGRNDPCPCGSGKKYKKCCGK